MHNPLYPKAYALIRGGGDAPSLTGMVCFAQRKNAVMVEAEIFGLPDSESGFFGFHIHEGASCDGPEFSQTQGHYNPDQVPHPGHKGDLPPLLSNQGKAYMKFLTDRFSINEILGRTLVIHAAVDNFTDQPSGNAGKKIACGIIRSV